MTSMFHAVEDAVADLGLAGLDGAGWDVVVGGLGLGYTARAALAHAQVGALLVVERLAPVIDWHARGLVPVGPELTADPRCRFLEGDFFALAGSPQGFDAGRRFHAVLLDHTPGHHLHPSHAAFYTVDGLRALAEHLHPGGVFSLWSNDPPDERFLELLRAVFEAARAEVVSFPNPLLEEDSEGTVYVARRGAEG
jgi:spermidine synthase